MLLDDVPESNRLVPGLTAIDRPDWAKARSELIKGSPVNEETIKWVESAVVYVSLSVCLSVCMCVCVSLSISISRSELIKGSSFTIVLY